jgi:hypothetical protein
VNPFSLEGLWLIANLIGVGSAAWLLSDALADRAAIKRANGRARAIIGNGDVRRYVIRLVISIDLLAVVLPLPREARITLLVIAPILIATNGVLDARERRRLAGILETDIANERRQKLRDAHAASDAQAIHDAQDARGVVQDARAVIQDERDAVQDARDKAAQ